MARRGAQKAQQFVAHEGQVNSLKIGRQSVGVLVTGGDDGKVNLWTIGKPAAILSLSGHTTAVTSVTFDTSEQRVLAGSLGGTLRVWDIEESKVLATMTGHRSAVQVVDFHPFSSYFASGSQDTNIKLWDWRQRGCAFVFKGHKMAVTSLVYSPDGRWIVSGGDDCAVKVRLLMITRSGGTAMSMYCLRAGICLRRCRTPTLSVKNNLDEVEMVPSLFLRFEFVGQAAEIYVGYAWV